MFFGSLIAARLVAAELRADPTIQADLGGRIVHGYVVPESVPLPALMFYTEAGDYQGEPVDSEAGPEAETLRLVVRVVVEGDSHTPIIAAATAQARALAGLTRDVTEDDEPYTVTFTLAGEALPTQVVEQSGQRFSQLGSIYTVEIYHGG